MRTEFSRYLKAGYFLALLSIIFIGRSPCEFAFPIDQLDPSWAWALSVFSQEHLAFGRDVIYNFGPLADLYTKFYNPSNSGLFAAMNFGIAVLLAKMVFNLSEERTLKEKIAVCGLLGLCLWMINTAIFPDVFYQIYCLVFVLWGFHKVEQTATAKNISEFCICALPLSLMVLMKGTFFFVTAVSISTVTVWGLWKKAYFLLAVVGLVLCSAAISVWCFWQQPLLGLIDYISNMVRMSSAYLDGMSLTGPVEHIYVYLAFVALIPVFVFDRQRKFFSLLFILCLEAFLYLGAKHGFGRHDIHAGLASAMVAAVLLAIFLFSRTNSLKRFVAVAVVGAFGAVCVNIIGYGYPENLLKYSTEPFKAAWTLILNRPLLDERYETAVQEIRDRYGVRDVRGTVDVYNFNNSVAIASTGSYTPRPVFQGYQAFDGYFSEINLKHLEKNPPDNVLFRLETIDDRYPTLDEGISWPSIFSNYDLDTVQKGYLFLKKSASSFKVKDLSPFAQFQASFGHPIAVPSDRIVFVKLKLKKTLLGRLATLIFKTTNVFIKIHTQDGTSRTYRLIPRMADTGFYLSPLMRGNEEVLHLFSDKLSPMNAVVSMELQTDHPGRFWNKELEVEFLTHAPFVLNAAFVSNWQGNYSTTELPVTAGVRRAETVKGYVDSVTVGPALRIRGQSRRLRPTSISGWFFDKTMPPGAQRIIVLQQGVRHIALKLQEVQRQDVVDYFHDASVANAGYSAAFNADELEGSWRIFAGYLSKEELVISKTALGECRF